MVYNWCYNDSIRIKNEGPKPGGRRIYFGKIGTGLGDLPGKQVADDYRLLSSFVGLLEGILAG